MQSTLQEALKKEKTLFHLFSPMNPETETGKEKKKDKEAGKEEIE